MTARTIEPTSAALAAKLRRFVQAIANTRRRHGLREAIRLAGSLAFEILMRPITRRQDAQLDRRLGIGTTGRAGLDPVVASTAAHGDGVAYSPTPSRLLSKILGKLPVPEPASFTFIDLGCGKGRVLLMAAEHGYGRVVGVELDPELVDVARRNVRTYAKATPHRAAVFDVVTADAAEYEFPPDPTIVFLFNPFGQDTLRAVVERIERSLARQSRPFVVAYFNPMHEHVLDGSKALTRVSKTARWSCYAHAGNA